MSKTSRFRHRREKSNQRKLREAVHPKPVTRTNEAEKPLSEPIIAPIIPVDPIEDSIFAVAFTPNKSTAPRPELGELSQGNPDKLRRWKNTNGTPLTGSRTSAPVSHQAENQKRLRNSSNRKDVR
jgi:hypothetical protein